MPRIASPELAADSSSCSKKGFTQTARRSDDTTVSCSLTAGAELTLSMYLHMHIFHLVLLTLANSPLSVIPNDPCIANARR